MLNSPKSSKQANAVIGIEIGFRTMYLVLLKRSSVGFLEFEKCQQVAFDPSLELVSRDFQELLKRTLKSFSKGFKNVEVWTVPKGGRARLYHLKVPRLGLSQLPGAVYWGLQREDNFAEDETVVDFQIESENQDTAVYDVTGALAPREGVDDVSISFAQAGHPLKGMGIPLLGLRNLVQLHHREKLSQPVLVCYVGRFSTQVGVLQNGRIVFTRNIRSGLEALANALEKELPGQISHKDACETVLNLGLDEAQFSADGRESLEVAFEKLQPTLERITMQIERTNEYYQNNFQTGSISTFFIGGEIAARGRLQNFISARLKLEVIPLNPISFSATNLQILEERDQIAFGAAYGIALESGKEVINFIDPFKVRQRGRKLSKISLICSVVMIAAAVAAAVFYSTQRLKWRDLKSQEASHDQTLAGFSPRLNEPLLLGLSKEVKDLDEQRKAAVDRYKGISYLAEITRRTPDNVSLLHVSTKLQEDPGTGPSKRSKRRDTDEEPKEADKVGTILLKGVVSGKRTSLETSLTIYVARLDQSSLFNNIEVNKTEIVQSGGNPHLVFTLTLEAVKEIKDLKAK